MGRQRFTPEQIIAKLREVDVIVGQGGTAVEACRQIGMPNLHFCQSSASNMYEAMLHLVTPVQLSFHICLLERLNAPNQSGRSAVDS